MGDERHVLRLLNGAEASIAKPVWRQAITSEWSPKMRQRVVSQRTSAHMEDAGQKLAGDLVHVRDHQQRP